MAVPTSFTDLSTTPATNATYISGSDSPIVLDDHLRTVYALIASVYANSGNGWAAPYLTAANPSYTGTLTGGTGIVNLGSGQFYKDASGNVGVGAIPTIKFHVTGSAATARVRCSSTDSSGAVVEILADSATGGVLSVNTAHPLKFQTDSAERARIDSTGNLLVGYSSSNGSYKLQVNSQIFATSSTVATSDGRYKQNITPLTGALAIINTLRPVSFDWKPHPVHNFSRDRAVGFIAQEVQAALDGTGYGPAIVKTNSTVLPGGTEESFLGIAEGNLIAVLAAAVQELAAQVQAIAGKVHALEAASVKPRRQKQAKAAN